MKHLNWKQIGIALSVSGLLAVSGIAGYISVIHTTDQSTRPAVTVENKTENKDVPIGRQTSTLEGSITIHFKWNDDTQPHLAYATKDGKVQSTKPGIPMKDEG